MADQSPSSVLRQAAWLLAESGSMIHLLAPTGLRTITVNPLIGLLNEAAAFIEWHTVRSWPQWVVDLEIYARIILDADRERKDDHV